MTRMLAAVLAVSIAAAPLATAVPVTAEIFKTNFPAFCATDVKAFEAALGTIIRGPTLTGENEAGYAAFTIEGTQARAVGVAMADGITWCIIWSAPAEGEPS
jgi:hypothetical protein